MANLFACLWEVFVGLLVVEVGLEATHITACSGDLREGEQGNPEDREAAPGADKCVIGSLLALITGVLQLAQDIAARAVTRDDHSSVLSVARLAGACPMILSASKRA